MSVGGIKEGEVTSTIYGMVNSDQLRLFYFNRFVLFCIKSIVLLLVDKGSTIYGMCTNPKQYNANLQ